MSLDGFPTAGAGGETFEKVTPLETAEQLLARECGLEIGGDPAMEKAWNMTRTYASTPLVMTFRGQTGTGKEPFSKAVSKLRAHNGEANAPEKPFVVVHCAALNEGIVESELFGHKKGAFTGAVDDRKGAFELADGGTLFLDEIGDMPLSQQAKLLRILEDGMYCRAGESKAREVKVKVVCATNQPLAYRVKKNLFRNDLYQRLRACEINLPSWAERTEEHRGNLMQFLLSKLPHAAEGPHILTPRARSMLLQAQFPGNVRDVKQTIERAYYFASTRHGRTSRLAMTEKDIAQAIQEGPAETTGAGVYAAYRGGVQVGPLERDGNQEFIPVRLPFPPNRIEEVRGAIIDLFCSQARVRTQGHVGKAAALLGLSRRSLTEHLKNLREWDQQEPVDPETNGKPVD